MAILDYGTGGATPTNPGGLSILKPPTDFGNFGITQMLAGEQGTATPKPTPPPTTPPAPPKPNWREAFPASGEPGGTGWLANPDGKGAQTSPATAGPRTQVFNGVAQQYISTGPNSGYWTSNGVTQPRSGPTGSAPISLPGAGGYEMSLVPGMSSPTPAPGFATAMQSALNAAQSPFIVNNIRSGATSAAQEAQYILDKAEQWAQLNPDLAAANPNWRQDAQAIANQYMSWVGNGAAQYSSTNGGLVPGLGSNAGINSIPMVGQAPGGPQGGVTPPAPLTSQWTNSQGTPVAVPPRDTSDQSGRQSVGPAPMPLGVNSLADLLRLLSGNQQGAYSVGTTPLGYTQWQQPQGQANGGGVDSQTALILAMLMGLMGTQGGTRRNFWGA